MSITNVKLNNVSGSLVVFNSTIYLFSSQHISKKEKCVLACLNLQNIYLLNPLILRGRLHLPPDLRALPSIKVIFFQSWLMATDCSDVNVLQKTPTN